MLYFFVVVLFLLPTLLSILFFLLIYQRVTIFDNRIEIYYLFAKTRAIIPAANIVRIQYRNVRYERNLYGFGNYNQTIVLVTNKGSYSFDAIRFLNLGKMKAALQTLQAQNADNG